MGSSKQPKFGEVWRLAAGQHGVVARRQLLDLGLSAQAIQHRLARGRLHRVGRGVYSVGRPQVSRQGRWMAAVLGCGRDAALSYGSAAALWGFERERRRAIEVSVGGRLVQGWEGVLVYRRFNLTPAEVVRKEGIQVTSVVRTLIDVASALEILRWRGPSTRSTDSA